MTQCLFLIGMGITFYSGRHLAKAKWCHPDPILPDAHYKHLESEVTSVSLHCYHGSAAEEKDTQVQKD